MNIETLKINLVQRLLQVGEPEVLQKIKELLDAEPESIVAYSTKGEPLTLSDYNAKLEKGRQQITSGESFTTEELRKDIANWKDK